MLNKKTPFVSVIMGTYNGSKTIERAVKSILCQSYTELEIIICDDCSSDCTYDLLEDKFGNDNRVILCRNDKNSGLSTSLNRCISYSKGELIARMDDDDISHLDRIEKQVNFMLSHDYALVSSNINYFDENGIYGCTSIGGERTKEEIYKGFSFAHPTVLMSKKVVEEVDGYSTDKLNLRGQDYDMWCKFYERGYKGFVMNDILLDYCESRESVKRRKFKYRYDMFVKKLMWRKRLHLPFWFSMYAFKDLLAGLVPNNIMLNRRKRKLK